MLWSGQAGLNRHQRVSVTGAGEDFSDGESVGVMFFLMRYQIVVASSREINFSRQFCSVSLVHRMETNIERQFFEVCPFISAVQQNLPDAFDQTSRRMQLLSIRRRWQIKISFVGG